jgi:tetratricopeptide (TPR) repeat protein
VRDSGEIHHGLTTPVGAVHRHFSGGLTVKQTTTKHKLLAAMISLLMGTGIVFAAGGLISEVEPGLTADQYASKSTELISSAQAAYPTAYADFPIWNQAIANAEAAVQADPTNVKYVRLLAMLYVKTQWWVRAMTNFDQLEALNGFDPETITAAAFVARRLGVLAIDRNDHTEAIKYFERSMALESNPITQALLDRTTVLLGF